jgi:hypothetical protein
MASEGEWRADPAGRHEYRFWDGEKWTEHVSDRGQRSEDPYDGTVAIPSQPPARMGTATLNQPAPTIVVQHKSHGCLWAFLIVAGIVIAGIVIVALAINHAVDSLNAEQSKHAITQQQFDQVQLGITHADLQNQLGKPPENTQEFVSKGILSETDITSSCLYYNRVGETFGSRYQFCFNGDSLESKNAY